MAEKNWSDILRPTNEAQLERLYQNTWLCTNCGERHSFTTNVCPKWTEKK